MPLVAAAGGLVRAEQLAVVFRQMPIALAVNVVNAVLTAVVLTPLAARPLPLAWSGAVALVSAARWLLWRRYRRTSPSPADAGWWAAAAVCGSLAAGLAWGVGGAVLFGEVPPAGQIFLAFVIGGTCTGATILSASHLPTLLAFLLPASLPLAVRFLICDEAANIALGAMIVVFAVALSLAGAYLNRIVGETMRLRVDLDEANARLQSEIAGHRAADAALRQAQKLEAIGQLTGGIAHDFNNLLTVVIGNLMLAGARAGDAAAVTPLLQGALQAADRGVALIQRLLAFARRQRLEPRPVDLRALAAGLEELLRRTLGSQIELRIENSGAAPAHVDSGQLELAILNLALNARDAMPKGGVLRIVIEGGRSGADAPFDLPSGDYVVLSVVDEGMGMDEATLARAFDPFFTTKEVGAGSGLGLPMVQGFAAQSGGGVCIRSRPGKGTTVELWLPRAPERPPEAMTMTRSHPEISPDPAKILLCNGDDEIGRFLSGWLASSGYVVLTASGPSSALRMLEASRDIQLLIVDCAMPEMTGLEVIRYARQRRPDLQPLLIRGNTDAPQGEEAAGVPVLHKPFAPAELTQRVEQLLAGRPLTRTAASPSSAIS